MADKPADAPFLIEGDLFVFAGRALRPAELGAAEFRTLIRQIVREELTAAFPAIATIINGGNAQ